ncbi:uncharacterized calcium-binding protein C50C3.5-like [Dromiciops gliroides]|uniref:uncharacterized calcium-binding protein C50C3.5-like n=1 Tax=Dromiciops gliroides TaxID=33562 RepID=UPI001CC80090|nr:uncharacterized calcium-binding protein C50C3.5-like [Dromiciops gliroides]
MVQGKLDMRSMKGALQTVNIHLSPQEVCEALRRADLDGDGAVDFDDFLGILTDNHRFAQCMDVQGPYSQVPNLPSRTRSTERRIRSRGPRLTNLARPCKPKPPQREAPRRVPGCRHTARLSNGKGALCRPPERDDTSLLIREALT